MNEKIESSDKLDACILSDLPKTRLISESYIHKGI